MSNTIPPILTREEVSQHYRVSTRTLVRSGPPFAKVGRKVLYRAADVDAWLEKHLVQRPTANERPLRRGRPTKAETIRRKQAAAMRRTSEH